MKKIEKLLFYIFVFSIPFQTRKILFLVSSTKFVEWTSGFLYFTDLLIVGILFLAILRGGIKFKKADIFLGLFFLIAGLSLMTSQNIGLSVYQLIKLAEFILLFLYVRANLEFLGINRILKIFVASGVFQSLIAILQFFNQGSLGLKHFESGIYNANIPGVATFFVNGVKFIRAYGTASHPNVLAVFLLLSIFCLYYLYIETRMTRISTRMTRIVLLFVLMLGLLLTFSRAIILVFIAGSLLFFLIAFLRLEKPLKSKIVFLFILFAICHTLFAILLWPEISARFLTISPEEQAVTLRVYYNDIALSIIKEKPLLGLGLGNFVFYLLNNFKFNEFWLYQPAHNLYLLIASEIGVFGLIVFLVFVGLNIWKLNFLRKFNFLKLTFWFLASCFLFLGLIDHYFWTIQQSRLIFWIALAIISGLASSCPRSLTDRTQVSGT